MVRRFRRAALAAAVAAGVAGAVAWASGDGARAPGAGVVVERAYRSHALGGMAPFEIYLPPRYETSSERFPVIYFLHGLPAPPYAFRDIAAVVRALRRDGRRAILVAPRGARDGDSDPEYLDWGRGRNWQTAIGHELPRYVDAHFRTIRSRRARALVGISAGGYGAVLLALHHLRSFSVIESWSGYFHPTDPSGTRPLDVGSPRSNRRASAHSFVHTLRGSFARRPTFFAFYVGRGDDRFRDENERLDRELDAAGVPHLFRLYPGAHARTLWNAHATRWLALALDHLERPR